MLPCTNVLVNFLLFSRLAILVNCDPVDRLGNKVKLSWKLINISKLESGEYSLMYETPEGVVSLQCKTVVLTIPSHVASTLLRPLSVSFFLKVGLYTLFMLINDFFFVESLKLGDMTCWS